MYAIRSYYVMVDNDNGKGAIFSSTEILGINQERMFSNIWKNAMKTKALADMSKTEAQEICKIIKTVNETGLPHILSVLTVAKKPELEILKMLEKNGVSLKTRFV